MHFPNGTIDRITGKRSNRLKLWGAFEAHEALGANYNSLKPNVYSEILELLRADEIQAGEKT